MKGRSVGACHPREPRRTAELIIALAQTNPTGGDIPGNIERIREFRRRASEAGAGLAIFPELVVVGYPPEDQVVAAAGDQASRLDWSRVRQAALERRGYPIRITRPAAMRP